METAYEYIKLTCLISFIVFLGFAIVLSASMSEEQRIASRVSNDDFKGSLKPWQGFIFHSSSWGFLIFIVTGTVGLAMAVARYLL